MLPFFLLFLRLVALEVTFIAIAYRLNGLFATIRSDDESPFFQPEGHPPKLSMIPLLVTLTAVTRVARRFLVN